MTDRQIADVSDVEGRDTSRFLRGLESLSGRLQTSIRVDDKSVRVQVAIVLVLLVSLTSAILIVANPGLFWDDWLWRQSAPSELIRIGQELGAWWTGYLSNAIWSLSDPVLFTRLFSVFSFLAGGVAFSVLLRKLFLATAYESILWLSIYCSCNIAIIRFIPSVFMYNVYIASFWAAWAMIAVWRERLIIHVLASLLFAFSFQLSSMLFSFGLVIIWLILQGAYSTEAHSSPKSPMNLVMVAFQRNKLVFLSPIILGIFVKLPSLLMVKAKSGVDQVNFYSNYNAFNILDLVHAIGPSLKASVTLSLEYIRPPASVSGLLISGLIFLVVFGLLWGLAKQLQAPRIGRSAVQILAGLLLTFASVYPYFVVGKPPIVDDFYEARHALPALPGLCLVILGALNMACSVLMNRIVGSPVVAGVRNAAVAGVIALSTSNMMSNSVMLLVDWIGQQSFIQYSRENWDKLDSYSMLIVEDLTKGVRYKERFIWNYEYTGRILDVARAQTHLGISMKEYIGSPTGSPLFRDKSYMRRFNLADFEFAKPHLILGVWNGDGLAGLRAKDVFGILRDYWSGKRINYLDRDVVRFVPFLEYRQADETLRRFGKIREALERFNADNGHYPMTTGTPPPRNTEFGNLAVLPTSSPNGLPTAPVEWYRRLSPEYIAADEILGACGAFSDTTCGVEFISNGVDFKLLAVNPLDLAYARQAFPDFFDRRRDRYGIWTPGAKDW